MYLAPDDNVVGAEGNGVQKTSEIALVKKLTRGTSALLGNHIP